MPEVSIARRIIGFLNSGRERQRRAIPKYEAKPVETAKIADRSWAVAKRISLGENALATTATTLPRREATLMMRALLKREGDPGFGG